MRASFELDNRGLKMWRRRKFTGCDRCPPHGGENASYKPHRKKKEFQLRDKKARLRTYKPVLHYPWND